MWTAEDLKKRVRDNEDLGVDEKISDPRFLSEDEPDSDLEQLFIFQLEAYKIPPPASQYHFAKGIGRRWRFDFAWPELKLAVEIDGGVYGVGPACSNCGRRAMGRHTNPATIDGDREKYNTATGLLGWAVLTFTPGQLERGEAIELLKVTLARLQAQQARAANKSA